MSHQINRQSHAMTDHPFNPKPTAVMRGLGGHIALSLGIAIAIAGAVGLPKLSGNASPASFVGKIAEAQPRPALMVLRDGKFIDRLDYGPVGEERVAPGIVTPAIFAMPMTAGWPEMSEADFAQVAPYVVAPASQIASASDNHGGSTKPMMASWPLPPRRPAILAETKPLVLQPIVVARAESRASVPAARADAPDASWRRYAMMPVETVSGVVSGAAGSIQSAGSWTVAQATGLLPSWR